MKNISFMVLALDSLTPEVTVPLQAMVLMSYLTF